MNASFDLTLESPCTAVETWRRIVDVRSHGDIVPLTRGTGPRPDELRTGDRLIARTALGPFGFDDVMVVQAVTPYEDVTLEKVGRVLAGHVMASCSDAPDDSCTVHWHQDVAFPFLPKPLSQALAAASAPVLRCGYRLMLTRLLRADLA